MSTQVTTGRSLSAPLAAAPAPARMRAPGHRWWMPALVLLLAGTVSALPVAWQAGGLDDTHLLQMAMICSSTAVLVLAVGLMLWWLALSRFSWRLRWVVALTSVLLGLAATPPARLVRWQSPDFTRGSILYPRAEFFWEPSADQRADEDRAAQEKDPNPLPAIDLTIAPTDFPRYRGRHVDGVADGSMLADDWSTPPNVRWKRPLTGGYAGFAVAGNVAVTLEQRRQQEVVACYDRNTGRQRWSAAYPAYHSDAMGDGPRATPTIDGDDVFSLGANGDLLCVDGRNGAVRWHVNVLTDSHATKVRWGLSGSPLVVGNRVIVNAGINPADNTGEALAAYDCKTGKRLWAAGRCAAGYSSPQLSKLDGVEQILLFDAGGLAGFDPEHGTELWRHPWKTFNDMNSIQPLVVGDDEVFISSELINGGAVLRVRHQTDQDWTTEVLWKNRELCTKYANPVLVGDHLYGLRDGLLVCVEARTGKLCWSGKRYGMGQLLVAGDRLIVVTDQGEIVFVAADPTGPRELGRLEVFKDKTWNTPALAGNQLFLRNERDMACVELPERK